VVLVIAAFLNTWALSINEWANTYYSAAVLGMTRSWEAFFYGAMDAGSFITVDKPPLALWLQALSARDRQRRTPLRVDQRLIRRAEHGRRGGHRGGRRLHELGRPTLHDRRPHHLRRQHLLHPPPRLPRRSVTHKRGVHSYDDHAGRNGTI
jgi:hypothetical protein